MPRLTIPKALGQSAINEKKNITVIAIRPVGTLSHLNRYRKEVFGASYHIETTSCVVLFYSYLAIMSNLLGAFEHSIYW